MGILLLATRLLSSRDCGDNEHEEGNSHHRTVLVKGSFTTSYCFIAELDIILHFGRKVLLRI